MSSIQRDRQDVDRQTEAGWGYKGQAGGMEIRKASKHQRGNTNVMIQIKWPWKH